MVIGCVRHTNSSAQSVQSISRVEITIQQKKRKERTHLIGVLSTCVVEFKL